VVKINFTESTLKLYKPDEFVYRKRYGQAIAFELDDQKPYVYTTTILNDSTRLNTRLILDTGAGHAVSLEQGSHPSIQLPKPALRTQLGTGLNGTIRGYLGRIQSIQLNKFKLTQVISSFPDHDDVGAKVKIRSRHGNLGNEILKRFTVIVDYSRSRLTLKPNALYRTPFEHDMCGVEIMAGGQNYNSFIISKVEPNSPAAEAGLKPRDEIIFINSYAASTLTMTKIDNLFHYKDGYRILLILRRNGQLIHSFVTLKRRI
jgi:hypothetical protein